MTAMPTSPTTRIAAALVAVAMAATLTACGDSGGPSSTDLLGHWRLTALQTSGAAAQAAPADATFSATFGPDGSLQAVADCNRCGGGFSAGDTTLDVGALACTRAYCTGSAPFDSTFESLLGTADRWEVQGSTLVLHGSGGTLTFVR
jgi:heat shock protein HslJ